METIIYSATREVVISDERPTVLIGERINPAGKKKMAEALKQENLDIVRQEAINQVEAGADIIDVCVGAFGVDEANLLPRAIESVMETVDVPLCIDSAKPEALEQAIEVCKGKPLINSVTGEERSLARILPLVKSHEAAVIGLLQDDDGIPGSVEKRVEIAHKIVRRAESIGIPREDIIIDCLTFAIGASPGSALVTIEAVHRVKAELEVNLTLAASNTSFGLPDRNVLNNAFVASVIVAGVTCIIGDVAKVRPSVLAADLIRGCDKHARRYTEAYRQRTQRDTMGRSAQIQPHP